MRKPKEVRPVVDFHKEFEIKKISEFLRDLKPAYVSSLRYQIEKRLGQFREDFDTKNTIEL